MELFLYNGIYDYTAEMINTAISGHESEDITLRINSLGGSTSAGLSIAHKLSEVKGVKTAVVDGDAASMAAFLLLFFNKIKVSSTSTITFHKVSYPSWYEASEDEMNEMNRENDRFKKMLEARLGEKGKSVIEKIFADGVRNDISLTADEALELGLINEVIEITPAQLEASSRSAALKVAEFTSLKKESNINVNTTKMNLDELKSQHYDVYKQAVEVGKKAEADRVGAFMVNLDVTENSVNERIKNAIVNNEDYSQKVGAEITKLATADIILKMASKDNTPDVVAKTVTPASDLEKIVEENDDSAKKEAEYMLNVKKYM